MIPSLITWPYLFLYFFHDCGKVGNILTKVTVLRINLNIDEVVVDSHVHTHPSHSQTSRFLSTSLSLGTPNPRST